MITTSSTVYSDYIKAHPNNDQYLNKRIEMYEEISLVVGEDQARGDFAKSYADVDTKSSAPSIDTNEVMDDYIGLDRIEEGTHTKKRQVSSNSTSSTVRHEKKLHRSEEMENK